MDFPGLPLREICDRARLARDARFDGVFFTAVKSTGIYCRPVCPAPPPRQHNVGYYPSAAAAGAAGYRPCLRCRPELSPQAWLDIGEETVRRALALIAEGCLQEGSVAALAADVGLSARQLQRVFLKQVGATPIQVHATHRLLLAKQLLTETALPVTQIALASGFNSLRRFNAAFVAGCGIPPRTLRKHREERPGDDLVLRLGYRPPLDFPAMLGFLRRREIPGIERIGEDSYERVAGPTDAPMLIHVSAVSDRPELRLRLTNADPRHIPEVIRRVRRMFDLDADLRAVHGVLRTDALLKRGLARRPGLRVPGGWDGFEIAVRAVLGQQVSVAGARTMARRVLERFGSSRAHAPAGLDCMFPGPACLRDAPLESIGLTRTRAATIRALAAAVNEGRLQFGAGQRLQDFIATATALPGIGAWTAHYIALRALGQPDAFPAGDMVLRQTLGGDRRLSEREAEQRSVPWQPWRAYAVMHLWHLAADATKEKT